MDVDECLMVFSQSESVLVSPMIEFQSKYEVKPPRQFEVLTVVAGNKTRRCFGIILGLTDLYPAVEHPLHGFRISTFIELYLFGTPRL